ncbi:MAG: hypothetical protein KIS76_06515 [Pyrinomonadaceae bacterium]|nr:hypothetical protein [Pyrinomonadaceae bacterium]
MIETEKLKLPEKPPMRCVECDRVMEHYNIWLSPANEERIVCWECQMREEKNFFTKRDFSRRSRRGVIPR